MLMGFEFRLQRVLKYREGQKKVAAEELSQRQRELALLQAELDGLRLEEEELLKLYRERLAAAVDVQLLWNIENYRFFLQASAERKQQEWQEYCGRVEEQRQVVIDSWRSLQVLEKLKEKDLMRSLQEEKIKEQRSHDELSLRQYHWEKG